MGWVPEFLESLTALSGGAARMADLKHDRTVRLEGTSGRIAEAGAVRTPGAG